MGRRIGRSVPTLKTVKITAETRNMQSPMILNATSGNKNDVLFYIHNKRLFWRKKREKI